MDNEILKKGNENKRKIDKIFKFIFMFFAVLSIVFLMLISIFIISKGIQPFLSGDISMVNFLFGMSWNPSADNYGIGYMILATIFSMLLSMIIAIPLSIFTAIAICEILPPKISKLFVFAIELLSGIPSIIYGIIGVAVIVPAIYKLNEYGINPNPYGNTLLATSIVLCIMVLPTIVSVSVASINAVPNLYKEASYGLGASKMHTIFNVILPASKNGIVAAIILGVGRAIGETIAVVMVAGNVNGGFNLSQMDEFLFQAIRPMTASIAVDIGYASGVHAQALFSTALVLFIFIFILNITVQIISKRGDGK